MKELEIVRKLLNELNKNILYCHWKSNQHFSNALVGIDDLDILVNRLQKNELIEILAKLNFKHFYTPRARTYVGIEDYLGFDDETGVIIHLHLHYQLVVGEKHLKGFHLPLEKMILKNRIYDKEQGVYFSSHLDELMLLLLRIGMKNRTRDILKKKVLDKTTYDEYCWLKELCPDFIKDINGYVFLSERIKEQMIKAYYGKLTWNVFNKMKKYTYKDLAAYSLGSSYYNTRIRHKHEFDRILFELKKKISRTNYTLLRRRSASGGTLIAFLGSDGSGKSSSMKEINSWLEKVMDVRAIYLGSGEGKSSFIRIPLIILRKILQKLKVINKTSNIIDNNLEIKDEKIGFTQRMWVYTLSKERIQKLIKAYRCRTRGYVVLTDRYPQNEFEGLCDGRRLKKQNNFASKKEEKCFKLARICPPDLVIKLLVSPEEAMKRKPGEINFEISKKLTERVKKINFENNSICVEVDANKPQKDVILEIKKIIWNAL